MANKTLLTASLMLLLVASLNLSLKADADPIPTGNMLGLVSLWAGEYPSFIILTVISPINTPAHMAYDTTDLTLEYTILNTTYLSWCGYSLNGESTIALSGNISITAEEGNNTLIIYCNNTVGDVTSVTVLFRVYIPSPEAPSGGGGGHTDREAKLIFISEIVPSVPPEVTPKPSEEPVDIISAIDQQLENMAVEMTNALDNLNQMASISKFMIILILVTILIVIAYLYSAIRRLNLLDRMQAALKRRGNRK